MTISCVSRIVSVAAVALAAVTPATVAAPFDADPAPVEGVPFVLRGSGSSALMRSGVDTFDDDALWYNGPTDHNVAFLSTVNDHVYSVVADDCWLKEGMFYQADYVYVRMAITEGFAPNTELWMMPDCDGKPDDTNPLVFDQYDYAVIDPAPTGDLEGTVIYEICYYVDAFGPGEDISWLAPVHHGHNGGMPTTSEGLITSGGGYGFWLSAGNGTIQGREAHVDAPVFGLPAWTPASDELCCGACTDMYIRVEGKCCWRVLDQDRFDLSANGGLYDPILSQNAPWTRSFEDFQLSDPCKKVEAWEICRIEAYVATNCDISTLYADVYPNDCDTPPTTLTPLLKEAPDIVEPTGDVVDGLPVYHLVFKNISNASLLDGHNYWLSIYSEQGFGAGKRTVWLFEQREPCNIRLNEAKYLNSPIGYGVPTPVSEIIDEPRGHAVSIWVCDQTVITGDGDDGDGTTGDDGTGGDDGSGGEDENVAPSPNRTPNRWHREELEGGTGGGSTGP